MHDLDVDDRDPNPPPWYSGPPKRASREPVLLAYVDTEALELACNNCGAPAGEFCVNDGQPRKMPCNSRITTAANAIRERAEGNRTA